MYLRNPLIPRASPKDSPLSGSDFISVAQNDTEKGKQKGEDEEKGEIEMRAKRRSTKRVAQLCTKSRGETKISEHSVSFTTFGGKEPEKERIGRSIITFCFFDTLST